MYAGAGREERGDMDGALVTEGWIQLGTMETNTIYRAVCHGLEDVWLLSPQHCSSHRRHLDPA